jgi:ligand-binding sensor domain-containing protein/signal transduction histidine kinase
VTTFLKSAALALTRAALVSAVCWPAIFAAPPPQVRIVRVPIVDQQDIRFVHDTVETAAHGGVVNNIVQDNQGFLWFGTSRGLLRYDGYQFRVFAHDPGDPDSIGGVSVEALLKDRSGNLWVGVDQLLDRYDPVSGIFKHISEKRGIPCGPIGLVRKIAQDREGMIWLATDSGLKRVDPSTLSVTCYQHREDDPSSLQSNLVKAVLETRDGTLWVASNPGLESFDARTGRVTRRVILRAPSGKALHLDGAKVTLLEDHAGILWTKIPARQESGLVSYDPGTGVQSVYVFGSGFDIPPELIEDEDQALWFGQWQVGIIRFDRDRKRAIRYSHNVGDPYSATAGGIFAMLLDREHRLWAATVEGSLDRFDPRPPSLRSYYHDPGNPNSLSRGAIWSVLQDSHGILWVGGSGGLDRFDRKTGRVTRYARPPVSSNSPFPLVPAIAEDRTGYVWVGTWGNGLARFDPRTGEYKFFRHGRDDPASLSSDIVESLFVDHRGALWIGTSGALDRFDPVTERFEAFKDPSADSSPYRAITEDSSGVLWLATAMEGRGHGLSRFDPATGRFTVYRTSSASSRSLSNDNVNCVYVDREGTLWAGTSNGLDRFDPSSQTFASYHERDGLASSVVMGILEDQERNLWVSTANGLSRFNPRTRVFRNYFGADGLPGNHFQPSAASKSSTGEMFFGSNSGLLAFFPERVVDDSSPPPVVLTDFWLFGDRLKGGRGLLKQSISFTRSLALAPSQNIFSLEYSALSYSDPSRNRYRYRLEPLEKEWNERDGALRLATYTTLPPGDYVFRVQGSNSRGVWNQNATSLQIVILPPWWSTAWFRISAIFIALLLLFCFYRLRIKAMARGFNARLEERVGERTRIARELHDTLLQSFQGLILRFQSARNQLPANPAKAAQTLDSAIDEAVQAVTEGRDAVQGLRYSTLETNDLALAISNLGEELASKDPPSSPELSVEVEGESRDLHPILRDEVYRIAGEALRNAFRHAQARRIQVGIRYGERQLRLRVRDDGKGTDPKVLDQGRSGHFGLPGMRERAELIRGRLTVESELGSGTELELTVPAAVAYVKPRRFRFFLK